MEQEIKKLIEKHYKTAHVFRVVVEKSAIFKVDDYVYLECSAGRQENYPRIALRILNRYPSVRGVQFTGGWVEAVYTRETLKWAGYKVK